MEMMFDLTNARWELFSINITGFVEDQFKEDCFLCLRWLCIFFLTTVARAVGGTLERRADKPGEDKNFTFKFEVCFVELYNHNRELAPFVMCIREGRA
jgi:hypothetical protein